MSNSAHEAMAAPDEREMKVSNGNLFSQLSQERIPEAASETARLLADTATSAERNTREYGIKRARLRKLQVERAMLAWELSHDDSRLVQDLSEVHQLELHVLGESGTKIRGVDSELLQITQSIHELSNKLDVRRVPPQTLEKSITVVDLARYSDIAKNLEQQLGTTAVETLDAQIQSLVIKALAAVGAQLELTLVKNTGDGAILAFDKAEKASHFGEELQRVAQSHNHGKDIHIAQRHFRVGISTNEVVLKRKQTASDEFRGYEMAGLAIANAVRLEAACGTGEVLIDSDTWAELPKELRRSYGPEEIVLGKREEQVRAHRRRIVDSVPWDTQTSTPKK